MPLTYSWSVDSLLTDTEVNDSDVSFSNSVVHVRWQKIGVDSDGNQGSFQGATPFTAINSNLEDFISFDQLQESDVIGWVQNVVVGDYEINVNNFIQAQINEIKTIGPVERTPPWVQAAPVDSA